MKYFCTIFLLSLLQSAHGFVLLSANPPRFPSGTITIKVNQDNCSNLTDTYTDIQALLKEAVDDYWNQVYSSSINFVVEGSIDVTDNDANALYQEADNFIAAGCAEASSTNTFAAAGLGCSTLNGTCTNAKGYLYINNKSGSVWENAARQTKIAILAHELGHAIGIGHSDKSYALMYFATNNSDIQYYLSEDDADAVTFLYPDDPELLGLGGNCGAVASTPGTKKKNSSPFLGLILGALVIILIRKLLKSFQKQGT